MATNKNQFIKELDEEFEEKVVREFVLFHRAIAEQTFREVVRLSPVWSGRFRGSHRIAIGTEPDLEVAPEYTGPERWPEPVPPANRVRALGAAEVQSILAGLQPFDTVIISNSLPYASRLENGHSKQAPAGVYTVAVQSIESQFELVNSSKEVIL